MSRKTINERFASLRRNAQGRVHDPSLTVAAKARRVEILPAMPKRRRNPASQFSTRGGNQAERRIKRRSKVTKKDLDQELWEYVKRDPKRARAFLDRELEEYFAKGGRPRGLAPEEPTPPPVHAGRALQARLAEADAWAEGRETTECRGYSDDEKSSDDEIHRKPGVMYTTDEKYWNQLGVVIKEDQKPFEIRSPNYQGAPASGSSTIDYIRKCINDAGFGYGENVMANTYLFRWSTAMLLYTQERGRFMVYPRGPGTFKAQLFTDPEEVIAYLCLSLIT